MTKVRHAAVAVKVRSRRAATITVKVTTDDEAAVMKRHRLYKRAVLPAPARNELICRNYQRLQRCIGCTPFARSLGDEAASVMDEVIVLTARTFDPGQYRNPTTGRRFTAADIGDEELDRLFRNYLHRAVNTALGRELNKGRREAAMDFGAEAYSRECDPAFLAEVGEFFAL